MSQISLFSGIDILSVVIIIGKLTAWSDHKRR